MTNTMYITCHIKAPRSRVYRALITADTVAQWMVPDDMSSHIHEFKAHEGGTFRISLSYHNPNNIGKSSAHTDTYHGYFATLVPDTQVVEVMEFETDDPTMQGEMTVTFTLKDATGGTDMLSEHINIPAGIAPADNELGWQMALRKLARLVEANEEQ